MKKHNFIKKLGIIILSASIILASYQYYKSQNNLKYFDSDLINYNYETLLVNYENPIPDDYETEIVNFYYHVLGSCEVSAVIVEDLQALFDQAKEEGLQLVVNSSYRSYEDQEVILEEKISDLESKGYSINDAMDIAYDYVSKPGYSEHQTGLAVDFGCYGDTTWDIAYDWLEENAYKYGFILRYPSNKIEVTHISNEPWHYRYVGIEMAKAIYDSGLCFEEYLLTI